ncbi:MAG: M48 family metallopeptidase [Desulfuromonadales bacterium]|nr:M48 family metallopeptidase [Desulfuromonadales bacterium]
MICRPPLFGLLLFTLFIGACTTVPVTGRQQLDLVPDSSLVQASQQQYQQFLQENPVVRGTPESELVQRIGQQIRRGVEQYFAGEGNPGAVADYQWEFNLVDSPEVNAFAMPGGKVVVYQGLLKIADTPAQLAAVVGHEVAHVVARHGNERVSQGLLAQMGGTALSAAMQNQPQATQQLLMTAFGAGAQVGVLLPFSRLQEAEADHLGLIFMALAGHDPNAAVEVWQKMATQGGAGAPEFLSTHPADTTRIENIRKNIPEAMRYYRPN